MSRTLLRGRVLTFVREPQGIDDTQSYRFWEDGAVLLGEGKVQAVGGFGEIDSTGAEIIDHRPHLILPGFIDTHLHYVQSQMIASYAGSLLEWLNNYTFHEEQRFAEQGHAEAVAVVLFIIIAWLSSGPKLPGSAGEAVASQAAEPFMAATHFAEASQTVQTRCAMCHTAEPAWPGVYQPPKNVILDSDIAVANHARDIAMQAGYSHAMPPGNVTEISPEERALLVAWFREGSGQ